MGLMIARDKLLQFHPHKPKEKLPHIAQEHLRMKNTPAVPEGPMVVRELSVGLSRRALRSIA